MFDELAARKKMFEEMGGFAKGESANELRSKYGPKEPEVEPVPGAEDEEAMAAEGEMPEGEALPEDVEALLAELTPEQTEELLSQA